MNSVHDRLPVQLHEHCFEHTDGATQTSTSVRSRSIYSCHHDVYCERIVVAQ